jgi:hypothetical protein
VRQWIGSRLTYANVMATIAVFLVLSGGTAVALSGSNTVFSDDIVNGEVKADDIGSNAVRSGKIIDGGVQSVDILDGAVGSPDILDGAVGNNDVRKSAITSGKVQDESLTGADVNESSFGPVPDAAHATNSDQLGGVAATDFQRRAVFPISEDLTGTFGGGFGDTNFSPSQLKLNETCGSNNVASVRFTNLGGGGATVNWLFSQGGTSSTVNASGTSLAAAGQGQNFVSFTFSNRLEGQWIFADATGVTTVNLHAFIAPGDPAFCEFKGTALWAPNT